MKMLKKFVGVLFVLLVASVSLNAGCVYDKVARFDKNTNSFVVWGLEKEQELLNDYNEDLYIQSIEQVGAPNLYKKMQDYANSLSSKIYIVDIIESKTDRNIVYIVTCTNQDEEKDGSVSYAWGF